jgi:hypothetical protein
MLPARTKKNHSTLEEVKSLFEQWRKDRKHRDIIPEALWDAAASLSGRYSLHEICTCLRLNYNDLKARTKNHVAISPAFIELTRVSSADCTIEMEKPTGERMRVKGSCTASELVRAFFS